MTTEPADVVTVYVDPWDWLDDEDDEETRDEDDQQFMPWVDDAPRHRPIWRDDTRRWDCTCGRASSWRLRELRRHADLMRDKEHTPETTL